MCTGTEVRNDLILEIYGHVPFFIIFDCILIKSQCVDRIEVCLDGWILRFIVCDDFLCCLCVIGEQGICEEPVLFTASISRSQIRTGCA